MFVFPCRVFAQTIEEARRLIVDKLASRKLEPLEEPKPFLCPVQCWSEGLWWEAYVKCTGGVIGSE